MPTERTFGATSARVSSSSLPLGGGGNEAECGRIERNNLFGVGWGVRVGG